MKVSIFPSIRHDSAVYYYVWLSAIEGYIPVQMMCAIHAFLEFCYIAQQDLIDTQSLHALEDALSCFHHHRVIFEECSVCTNRFNLPRQHFLMHYPSLIWSFGSPNGLCFSITKSKHIKAVKWPWGHSSHHKALSHMLITNQRLDKLAACHADFTSCGILANTDGGDVIGLSFLQE